MSRPCCQPPKWIEFRIQSHPANLAAVRKAVETFAAACGFIREISEQIGLCVNEALSNVIRHAYRGSIDRPVKIGLECLGDALRITIRDWGNGTPPPPPPMERDPLTVGGLGLVCLQELMSEVTYHPQADGMLLTMVRTKPHVSECHEGEPASGSMK